MASEMNAVIRRTSDTAEVTASSSERMNAGIEEIRRLVAGLIVVAGKNRKRQMHPRCGRGMKALLRLCEDGRNVRQYEQNR
jgi:hypothetical protein